MVIYHANAVVDMEDFQFDLVQHHGDYIEFFVSYRIEYNRWAAEGIGWLVHDTAHYYLRTLKLNNWPAASHYNEKANLGLDRQSLIFHSDTLDQLTIANIIEHIRNAQKSVQPLLDDSHHRTNS